jgi:hypothetical protein
MHIERTAPANDTPSESFLEYNQGMLEVREGKVYLLTAGWEHYRPRFAAAGLTLRDSMPLAEFKQGVRAGVRAGLRNNDQALVEHAAKLCTPVEDKQFIRRMLNGNTAPLASAAANGQVLSFPGASAHV